MERIARPVEATSDLAPGDPARAALQSILTRVEASSPSLRAADENALARGADVQAVRGEYFGQVSPFAKATQFNFDRLVNPLSPPVNISTIPFDNRQYGVGLMGRLPIDFNGRIHSDVEGARAEAKRAQADVLDLRLRVMGLAAQIFRKIQINRGAYRALESQHAALSSHVDVAREAVRVGSLALVEQTRVEAELQAVQGRMADLDGKALGLRASMAALMGAESFTSPVPPPTLAPVDSAVDQRLWSRRPDLQAAHWAVESAAARMASAKAKGWPVLDLVGSVLYNDGFDSAGRTTSQVGLNLAWPAWTGGTRSAAIRSARHQLRVSKAQLEVVENQARAAVASERAAWNAARDRNKAAQAGLLAARETARVQTERFTNGRLSAADLVDAEAALAAAESEAVTVMATWWQADDAFRIALGLTPSAYPNSTDTSDE